MKYYMFNKPSGCITAKRDMKHPVIMDYFNKLNNNNLNPVGRLDIDTEGLIFVTDDGKWNNMLMNPENHVEKKYFFWVLGEISNESVEKLEKGIIMKGMEFPTKPAKVKIEKVMQLRDIPDYAKGKRYEKIGRNKGESIITSGYIAITEGKKHQIKRMMKAVGGYVIYLKRVSIGNVMLDNTLEKGEYRELTQVELDVFNM
jgi:16S rRNA pseudouridine516 synthase